MSRFVELISSRHAPHFVVLTLVSVGFGGCSADTQTRFSDTSFSNPFASRSADATGLSELVLAADAGVLAALGAREFVDPWGTKIRVEDKA